MSVLVQVKSALILIAFGFWLGRVSFRERKFEAVCLCEHETAPSPHL